MIVSSGSNIHMQAMVADRAISVRSFAHNILVQSIDFHASVSALSARELHLKGNTGAEAQDNRKTGVGECCVP